MNHLRRKARRIMAVFPDASGFGYAVFEGLSQPIDWGTRYGRGNKNIRCLKKISALFTWYQPDVVVLEDHKGKGSRKTKRVRCLIQAIAALARTRGIKVFQYSRAQIQECFSELCAKTKEEIAVAIARYLPMFEEKLPRTRKLWMKEDSRMKFFDAIALIFTFFYFEEMNRATP